MVGLGFGMMLFAAVIFAVLVPWGDRPGRIKNEAVESVVATAIMLVLIFGAIFALGVH